MPSQSTRRVDQIAFYSIKIRLETPEIRILSVALFEVAISIYSMSRPNLPFTVSKSNIQHSY